MKTTRILALLLVFLLTFCLLTACAATPSDKKTDDTKPAQSGGDEQEEESGFDYKGEEFYFVALFPDAHYEPEDEDEIYNPSAKEEALIDHVLKVEKKYNMILKPIGYPSADTTELAALLSTGDAYADFIYWESTYLLDLCKAGLLADMNTLEAIDLTDESMWGSATSLARTQYKGQQYAFAIDGTGNYPMQAYFYGILMQKNGTFESYETDWTVAQLVESGDWTFDTFLECLGDIGEYDTWDTHYSFAINATYLYDACLAVNEASRVVYDEETGKYVYGLLEDAAIEAMEFARSVYNYETTCKETNSINAFARGDYTWMLTNCYRAFNEIASTTTDITWLPFPYGPHSVYGESTCSFGIHNAECAVAVFKGTSVDDDPDAETQKNGYILNELFGPIDAYGEEGYIGWLSHNLFPDDNGTSWSVYKQLSKNVHSSQLNELGTGLSDQVRSVLTNVMKDTSLGISETLDTLTDAVNSQLDESVNNPD